MVRGTRIDFQLQILDRPAVSLPQHQLLICDEKSTKVGSLLLSDLSELQNSNLKFQLNCKPK
jgi:hypothetical protein